MAGTEGSNGTGGAELGIMQHPHLPRLYLGHGGERGPSRMLDSPAAQYYASPATYGSTPFASGRMLSPPGLDSGRPFAGAHSPEGVSWEEARQGGAPASLGVGRTTSFSSTVSVASTKKDESKKRKVVVRLPLETLTDDEADPEQQARLSIFARAPLVDHERETVIQRMEDDDRKSVALEAEELVGRASHPDEVKMGGLPESIDVYLPGKSAWEEVWDTFLEDMKEKYRQILLPPRLRNALDGVKRASSGHASSLSLSFASGFDAFHSPLTSSTTAVTSPGAISPLSGTTRLTPFAPAFVPSSTLATPVATPLPMSPAPVKDLAMSFQPEESIEAHKPAEGPTGGSDVGHDGAAETKDVNAMSPVLVPVEAQNGEHAHQENGQAVTSELTKGSDGRSLPSRRTSGMSTKTDRTGVASDWSGSDVDSSRSPSLSPKQPRPDLSTELSRALEDLGPLKSPEQLPALPVLKSSAGEPIDGGSDDSQYGDGELSDFERDEHAEGHVCQSGSPPRLRSKLSVGAAGLAPPASLHLSVDAEALFQAPSDIDRPDQGTNTTADASFHRVKRVFEFPPRSAHEAAGVALPPSSPESARDEYGLPRLPPPGTFGGAADVSPNDRFDFDTFGQPGSLAVSPIAGFGHGWRPSSNLDASANEFSPTASTFFSPAANETPRRNSGSHGPLPPLPLTACKIPSTKAFLEADSLGPVSSSMRRVISAPVLVHPQPRRPLPSPPLYMSTPPRYTGCASADDDVELLREPADDRAAQSGFGNRSVASVDDPLPEQYAPIRPILTKEPAPRTVPTVKNGPRLPQESTAGQASPARMGDPRARMDNIDPPLPTVTREMGRAVPLEQRPGSTANASSIIDIDEEQMASFTDNDDVPLLFLEKLITDQFDQLRTELAATRPDDKLSNCLKSISERLELLSTSVSSVGGIAHGLHPSSAGRSRNSTSDGSLRPDSAPITRVATPGLDVSPALAYSGFLEDLKATVQPLVAPQLSTSALAGDIASSVAQQLDSTFSRLLSSTVIPKLAAVDEGLGMLLERTDPEKVSESARVVELVQNALMPLSELATLVENVKVHLAGPPATTDLARIADLGTQLAKARNEHGKARSEKAVLSDRLEAAKARYGEEMTDLRARLAKCEDGSKAGTLELALRDAAHAVVEDGLDRTRRELDGQRKSLGEAEQARIEAEEQLAKSRGYVEKKEREGKEHESLRESLATELAKAQGEIAALEKRLASQDERFDTVQRLKAVQQQSLAAANQRITDLRKDLADLEQLKETLKEVTAERETACSQEAALQERCNTLVEENDRFRRHFDSLQQGLETMKVTVRRELEEADARVADANAQRDRLAAENARLVEQLSSLQPLSTPSTPIVVHHPSALGKLSGEYVTPLQPQHTGSSAGSDITIAHTDISPTPSIASQSFTRADDGWYSSAE
ncbi:hypothetical protein JCM10295v2_005563 [Rhodotorula toruloides]